MPTDTVAQRLLDAHVAWLLGQMTPEALPASVEREVDELLAIGSRVTVADLVDPATLKDAVHNLFTVVPPSTGASTLVAMLADVMYDGPAGRFTLADVLDRENVERLADEALANVDLLGSLLDDLTRSPLVTSLASRFMTKVVADVVQTNRAMAEKIPGVGSLVSFGANAAGKVGGAASKQVEARLGDTAAKGAAFAARRLNSIVVETLKDPATRRAVLEIFDLYADQPVTKLRQVAQRDDVHRVAGLLQDIVIAGAPTDPIFALTDALVDGFLRVYGEHPASTLVADLGIDRDTIVAHATVAAGRALGAARASGDLERVLRERLGEFYGSPEVTAILH